MITLIRCITIGPRKVFEFIDTAVVSTVSKHMHHLFDVISVDDYLLRGLIYEPASG